MAFQLTDDCLDYTSRNEELGKAVGNDLKEGKITLPLIHLLKNSTPDEKQETLKLIGQDDLNKSKLIYVINMINKYKCVDYAMAKAKKCVADAKTCLEIFEPSPERSALIGLADYVFERRF